MVQFFGPLGATFSLRGRLQQSIAAQSYSVWNDCRR